MNVTNFPIMFFNAISLKVSVFLLTTYMDRGVGQEVRADDQVKVKGQQHSDPRPHLLSAVRWQGEHNGGCEGEAKYLLSGRVGSVYYCWYKSIQKRYHAFD